MGVRKSVDWRTAPTLGESTFFGTLRRRRAVLDFRTPGKFPVTPFRGIARSSVPHEALAYDILLVTLKEVLNASLVVRSSRLRILSRIGRSG
jgi:hypothetical protein